MVWVEMFPGLVGSYCSYLLPNPTPRPPESPRKVAVQQLLESPKLSQWEVLTDQMGRPFIYGWMSYVFGAPVIFVGVTIFLFAALKIYDDGRYSATH